MIELLIASAVLLASTTRGGGGEQRYVDKVMVAKCITHGGEISSHGDTSKCLRTPLDVYLTGCNSV